MSRTFDCRGVAAPGWRVGVVGRVGVVLATCAVAGAQTTFSLDERGPTIGLADGGSGTPITEGDLLMPTAAGGRPAPGFLPVPSIVHTAGDLGLSLYGGCVGHAPGVACGIEVDALSYGLDGPALAAAPPGRLWFSVDSFAEGFTVGAVPSVETESGGGGAFEAGSDLFVDVGLPLGPVCGSPSPGSAAAVDGNGVANATGWARAGLGLVEPDLPFCPPPDGDLGDEVDAADVDGPPSLAGGVYFSLEGNRVDPLCPGVPGSGSAGASGGFSGADVLVTTGGAPTVYASAVALGLDLAGAGSDDLDALAVFENGVPGFQPSALPYDWTGGASDMVLFSVRRGSAVVGQLDSACGLPIEPGDVLTAPVAGGATPFPAILVAAEALGLVTTRSHGVGVGDDLDALDVTSAPLFDCDGNGVEDAVDVALGTLADADRDGVPDLCQLPVTTYCTGKTSSLGCVPFVSTQGTPSVTATGAFQVRGNDLVPGEAGFLIYGTKRSNLSFHGGKLCVKAPFVRLGAKTAGSGGPPPCAGVLNRNFNARIQGGGDPQLTAGHVVRAQWRQRDPADPTGFGDALTDGVEFVIAP